MRVLYSNRGRLWRSELLSVDGEYATIRVDAWSRVLRCKASQVVVPIVWMKYELPGPHRSGAASSPGPRPLGRSESSSGAGRTGGDEASLRAVPDSGRAAAE